MGCDIHGFVEVKDYGFWSSIIDVGHVLDRNYDLWGYLFGVRNYVNFKSLFANRELPKDISYAAKEALEKWDGDAHSTTWVTLKELQAVDWDVESTETDDRIHMYRDGKYVGKASYTFEQDLLTPEQKQLLSKGEHVTTSQGTTLVYEKTKAEDLRSICDRRLFEQMELLGKQYGEDNVRLVVWFDN